MFHLDNEFSINSAGEFLRDQFFDQRKGYGCYQSFDLRNDVEEALYEEEDEDIEEKVVLAYKLIVGIGKVWMKYYWSGDGFLEFRFGDGKVLQNMDCKKDHCWRLVKEC